MAFCYILTPCQKLILLSQFYNFHGSKWWQNMMCPVTNIVTERLHSCRILILTASCIGPVTREQVGACICYTFYLHLYISLSKVASLPSLNVWAPYVFYEQNQQNSHVSKVVRLRNEPVRSHANAMQWWHSHHLSPFCHQRSLVRQAEITAYGQTEQCFALLYRWPWQIFE